MMIVCAAAWGCGSSAGPVLLDQGRPADSVMMEVPADLISAPDQVFIRGRGVVLGTLAFGIHLMASRGTRRPSA